MKKIIPSLIASFLFAITLHAQSLNAKITVISKVNCMQDSNGVAAVDAWGGVSPYTYLWMPSGQTTDTATGLHATFQYTITVIDAVSDTTITYITIPTISTLGAVTTYTNVSCFGLYNGTASVLPSGGTPPYKILWTPPLDTILTITGLPAGTYTSTVTDVVGCKVKKTAGVSQPTPLILTASSIDSLAAAYATGGTGPYTFSWMPGGKTTASVSGLAPGTYTVTVHDAHLCYNSAVVTISSTVILPSILFYFPWTGQCNAFCGAPSYIYFPIMVEADSAEKFNNCVVDIDIGKNSEFAGDSISNGGVIVTRGTQFQPGFGNDYNIFDSTQISDSVIEIKLGSPADTSPNGTIIPPLSSIPDTMFYVQLRIQNPCLMSKVTFTNDSINSHSSGYTLKDTVPQIDTISSSSYYLYCCPFPCYDSSCSCNTSCYDSSLIVTYVIDTLPPGPARTITYSNTTYYGSVYCNTLCGPHITDFNDSIKAGINDILTITGSGFGNPRGTGQVQFRDADSLYYYAKGMNNLDYISWTNTQIKIRLPGFADSVFTNLTNRTIIGGGDFNVVNSCGEPGTSGYNLHGNRFSVYYNLNQDWIHYNNDSTQPQKSEMLLRNIGSSGGYVLHLNPTDFPVGSMQRLIFTRAVKDWVCFTGVNWSIGSDTVLTFNIAHPHSLGVNYVFFTTGLSNILVAETPLWQDPCPTSAQLPEGDMYFNADTHHIHFFYDTTELLDVPAGQIDYYEVCLHELGHLIGLDHDVVQGNLMYWAEGEGPLFYFNRVTLWSPKAASAVDGGIYSVHQSTHDSSGCDGALTMVGQNSSCVNETSVKQIKKNTNFVIYPNPSQGTFTIESSIHDYTLVVINMLGQRILTRRVQNSTEEISLSTIANGMYFVQEQYNNGMATQKLIITKK